MSDRPVPIGEILIVLILLFMIGVFAEFVIEQVL